ncbi:MAG: flagellar basal body P-ring protein FlgI [Alphaproteobacteria bacterium]|nr:flagellar basal body P-ring protein FlgI [Alphaproteobacteria bacterium]
MTDLCRPRPTRLGRTCAARTIVAALVAMLGVMATAPTLAQTTRIKDIVEFEGVRDNMLVGYGLVVGLSGSGDSLNRSIFTRESLLGMLERLGVNARTANNDLRTRNIAAVMVTATLPPFARQGSRIDVQVSAMADANSLLGGTLLVTPLLGADGEVYAVAQGQIAVGGFRAQGQAATVTRGVPTNGRIANGGIVERETGFELASLDTIKLALRNPDLTTARRISQAINAFAGQAVARALDPKTVQVQVPGNYRGDVVGLLTDIERLPIEPDQVARVVIDETNGVIVMGENVRISTVAVAQGNLTIRVTETPQVSQPAPFAPGATGLPGQTVRVPRTVTDPSTGQPIIDPATGQPRIEFVEQAVPGQLGGGAQTVVVPRTQIEVDDQAGRRLAVVPAGVTLGELVNGLNALGVGPRDLITILQTIKASGALQAEIEVL